MAEPVVWHHFNSENDVTWELTEVRHDRGRTSVNSFKISSSSCEVYTTFTIEFEPLGEAQIELLQK